MSTAQFTDAESRDWPLVIDFPDISRIKKRTGIDLLSKDGMANCTDDLTLLVDVMYVAWQELAEQRNIDDESFGRLVSHHFAPAVQAFNEALADFFHRIGRGPMAATIRTAMRLAPQQAKTIEKKLDQNTLERLLTKSMRVTELEMETELAKAEAAMDTILGDEPANSEPSSESGTSSPPEDSPTEN